MKHYPKEYEDFYTHPRTLKKCNLDHVSADGYDELSNYIRDVQDHFLNFQLSLFDFLVKTAWLFRKYTYHGTRRYRIKNRNNHALDGSFAVFMRYHIGYNHRLIIRNDFYNKILTYLFDLFPDFDVNNPFEKKYEYPYTYMKLECLILVYQLDERLELLQYGEDHEMSYSQFFDYIINYVMCYNDEHGDFHGEDVYALMSIDSPSKFIPYVANRRKKHYVRSRRKRKIKERGEA